MEKAEQVFEETADLFKRKFTPENQGGTIDINLNRLNVVIDNLGNLSRPLQKIYKTIDQAKIPNSVELQNAKEAVRKLKNRTRKKIDDMSDARDSLARYVKGRRM